MADARNSRKALATYVGSHNDDVTDLAFHPSHVSRLLSGSTDGLVNVYDTTIADEDDALLQVFNHGSSIAHTGFLSDDEIFALSHDEIFTIYPIDQPEDDDTFSAMHAFGDLRPQLHCEYVADLVSSQSAAYAFGAGSHSAHSFDIIPLHQSPRWVADRSNAIRLVNAHGDDIVRSICFSHNGRTIFSAGEDGLIRAWQVPEDHKTVSELGATNNLNKKRQKHKHDAKHRQDRFNPY
ncbi:MAG: hypothetical protein Q9220_005608 [cf. Caloplaca sp. 1 TL-2023]